MTGYEVRLDGVDFAYGAREALRDVTLRIEAGEAVALLGPNGAGKTTLTRLVIGLARPRAGLVRVGDWEVPGKRPDEMARRVGYVFQHSDQQLFARTVAADVAFGPRQLGRAADGVRAALLELGLEGLAAAHPYDLPAPMRKVVALAGVLAMEPGVLVLDEPTTGLDRAGRDRVIRALRRRHEAGVTVLSVSHDLAFVAEAAERVVVLRDGRVVADASARALLRDEAALAALGLRLPPAAALGLALDLPGAPIRMAECAAVLRGARWTAPAVQ
ncbi:MAG: ABC transporter ATP-binding protein [Gemmatimonadetes bacterium]|nr:ABC transporter ATP-binding protein [Gemmatimonadota bacterium]